MGPGRRRGRSPAHPAFDKKCEKCDRTGYFERKCVYKKHRQLWGTTSAKVTEEVEARYMMKNSSIKDPHMHMLCDQWYHQVGARTSPATRNFLPTLIRVC